MGYTLEELTAKHGTPIGTPDSASPSYSPSAVPSQTPSASSPSQGGGMTLEQLEAKHGKAINAPAVAPTASPQDQKAGFFTGLNIDDSNPFQPSADTLGGKIFRGVEDLGYGSLKALGRLPVHIGQFVSGLLGNDGDNVFNADSARGQYVNQAAKGSDTLQKIGATGTDIATLFSPGGAVSEVGEGANALTKVIPGLGDIAANTGTAGKLARFAPKLASTLAETYAGNAALTGNAGFKDPSNALLSLGGAAVAPLFRGARTAVMGLSDAGRSKLAEEGADRLTRAFNANDPFEVGAYKQASEDFSKNMRDLFKKNNLSVPNRVLASADSKFANMAARAAAADPDYVPSEKDVFNNIFDRGQIDGLSRDGNPITTTAQNRQNDVIKQNAELLQKQFESSNAKINGNSIGQSVLSGINGEQVEGGIKNAKAKIAQDMIDNNPVLKNPQATPGELFQASKNLRDAAYLSDGVPGESTKADVFRQTAAAIDKKLFGGAVNDIDMKTATELRKNQAIAYSSRSVLKSMEKLKVRSNVMNTITKAAGAAVGYTHGGFLGSVVGAETADAITKAAQTAYGNRTMANNVIQRFAERATKEQIADLAKIVEQDVGKNKSVAAEKNAADQVKKFIEKAIRDSDAGNKATVKANAASVRDYMTNYNEGGKYVSPKNLPTIDFGKEGVPSMKKPVKGLKTIYANR